jgi:hypothetical protein
MIEGSEEFHKELKVHGNMGVVKREGYYSGTRLVSVLSP